MRWKQQKKNNWYQSHIFVENMFCEADIYPRLDPTMEWDTVAAHAVVLEAGMGLSA